MTKYTAEQFAPSRRLYTFAERNRRGEEIAVEITACENHGGPHSLPHLWKKTGHTPHELESYLCVDTYVTDRRGICRGLYNPQHKISEDGKRRELTEQRGATPGEAAAAEEAAARLEQRLEAEQAAHNSRAVVVGTIPGHMANPPLGPNAKPLNRLVFQ